MRTVKRVILVVFALLVMSGGAVAHEGHDHADNQDQHLKGKVEAIDGSHLRVKSTDGKPVDVHVDDSTKYESGGAPAKLNDLKVGAKVVVHGERMKDGTLHATQVRFGKPRAK